MYKTKNKLISDIYIRTLANLPISGGYRELLENEWQILEKRIKKYYKLKVKTK